MDNLVKTNILPLPGFVLIQPLEDDTIKGSAGSFQYADNVEDQETQKVGKIVKVGAPTKNDYGMDISCNLKEGTIVIHKQYSVDKLKYKNEELRLVKFQDLLAVIKE